MSIVGPIFLAHFGAHFLGSFWGPFFGLILGPMFGLIFGVNSFVLGSFPLNIQKKCAPKNDADWCNRFVQNSHGEPIGDKNDSWAITAEAVMGCCNSN